MVDLSKRIKKDRFANGSKLWQRVLEIGTEKIDLEIENYSIFCNLTEALGFSEFWHSSLILNVQISTIRDESYWTVFDPKHPNTPCWDNSHISTDYLEKTEADLEKIALAAFNRYSQCLSIISEFKTFNSFESLSKTEVNDPTDTQNQQYNSRVVNIISTLINPKFILAMMGITGIVGGIVATSVIKNNCLLTLPYFSKSCTVYLQEFQTVNTLEGKQNKLLEAIQCFELIKYPTKDYLILNNLKAQLNPNLSINQAFSIFQDVQNFSANRKYLSDAPTHPIRRYSCFFFQFIIIEVIFILAILLIWLMLIIIIDYFFFNKTLLKAILII